jgi:glycosyltransferase involved in cell wall biosynthesis
VKKINVLFLMPQMGMGGSERLVHDLVRRMDKERFNASVAWLNVAEPLQEFRDLNVPLYYVPKTKRVDLSTIHQLATIIRTRRIDVVSAQHFMPAIYAYYGSRIAGKALVFTAHSRWEIEDTPVKWRIAGRYLLRGMAATIGVAPDVSNAIQAVFGTRLSQTVTIENGVDLELFTCKKDLGGLRSSLGLVEGEMVVGIVANLKKVKNHLFLLEAFSKIASENSLVKLLIIGRGFPGESDNTESELRAFAKDRNLEGRVLFLGFRPDVAELLCIMDVFCLTSLREGLPIGLIEAMAAGLPVIGTNVEGIRDVIDQGVNGLLVETGEVEALGAAVATLLADPRLRQRLGKAAREKAVKRYSLERCVREYEQLFLSIAADTCRHS